MLRKKNICCSSYSLRVTVAEDFHSKICRTNKRIERDRKSHSQCHLLFGWDFSHSEYDKQCECECVCLLAKNSVAKYI